jgi:hypothetical protein
VCGATAALAVLVGLAGCGGGGDSLVVPQAPGVVETIAPDVGATTNPIVAPTPTVIATPAIATPTPAPLPTASP